jgi:hypothetical protein
MRRVQSRPAFYTPNSAIFTMVNPSTVHVRRSRTLRALTIFSDIHVIQYIHDIIMQLNINNTTTKLARYREKTRAMTSLMTLSVNLVLSSRTREIFISSN